MRIDSHHFLTPQHPIEHLAPILARNRFEGSIWVAAGAHRDLTPAGHAMIQGIVVDWQGGPLEDHPKLCAVRWDLAQGMPGNLQELARRNLALDLQLRPEDLPLVPRIAEAAPEARIVLDDLASPPYGALSDSWAEGMEAAARYPRVYCKTGGLVTNSRAPWKAADTRPYVQFALKAFGPRRVMFASGWPECLPAHTWKETLAAFTQSIGAQAIETRELLLGENARRVYALERARTAQVS